MGSLEGLRLLLFGDKAPLEHDLVEKGHLFADADHLELLVVI